MWSSTCAVAFGSARMLTAALVVRAGHGGAAVVETGSGTVVVDVVAVLLTTIDDPTPLA